MAVWIRKKFCFSWTDILKPLDGLIDWTISYRQDSTIFRPYCYSLNKDTNLENFINNYTGRFLPETRQQSPKESRFVHHDNKYSQLVNCFYVQLIFQITIYKLMKIFWIGADHLWWQTTLHSRTAARWWKSFGSSAIVIQPANVKISSTNSAEKKIFKSTSSEVAEI